MSAVGIDPDTKATGVAEVFIIENGKPRVMWVETVRAKGRYAIDRAREMSLGLQKVGLGTGLPDVLVVEWQEIRMSRGGVDRKRPNNILQVAIVAGMALGAFEGTPSLPQVYLPTGRDWGGSIPKAVRQKRILKDVGLTLTSPIFSDILPSQRTHVVDAIGLAVWGLRQQAGKR